MPTSLPAPISVLKLANGRYRWWGVSSVNIRDVDGEIFSEKAMLSDVERTKASGDDSRLLVYHIDSDSGERLGGAPDWREVINGHLLESGLFDDTPLARGFAKFFAAHPEGVDGSGNAMSIGFNGMPDADGVFAFGIIKERSILPRSQAAVPFTMLTVKEAVLEPRQIQFLENMKAMMDDPEVVQAANLMLAAAKQSKALDEAGLQRKAALIDSAATPTTPMIQFNTPGTYTVNLPGATSMPASAAAQFGFAAPLNVKEALPDEKPKEDAPPAEDKPLEEKADPLPEVATEEVGETETTLSDTDLMGIAQYIDTRVGEMVAKLQADIATMLSAQLEAAIPKMIKATQAVAADTAQNEVVKAYNEQPKSTFERLQQLSISNRKNGGNTTTVIPAEHPLFTPNASADNPQGLPEDDGPVSAMRDYLGFGKKPGQNGATS